MRSQVPRQCLASKSIFQVIFPDADEFDQTLIWKRLYDALDVTEESPTTAAWDGQLSAFCPAEVAIPTEKENIGLEIYELSATE